MTIAAWLIVWRCRQCEATWTSEDNQHVCPVCKSDMVEGWDD